MSEQIGSNFQIREPRVGDLWVNPITNVLLSESEVLPSSSFRHYFGKDINGALASWGRLQGEVAALSDVQRILAQILKVECSRILEVFFHDLKSYVAIVFENSCDRASAWVYVGHVDHRCELPGSDLKPDGVWRTLLPTSSGSGVYGVKSPAVKFVDCPSCGYLKPVSSQCDRCE